MHANNIDTNPKSNSAYSAIAKTTALVNQTFKDLLKLSNPDGIRT